MPEIETSTDFKPRGNPYVYLISFIAAVGGFIFGYDMMIMSGAILYLKKEFGLTESQEGFAMVSANYSVLVTLLFAGYICDGLGRKKTLFLSAVLFGASAIGTAVPRDFNTWNIFRIIGGIGCGLAGMVSPMYIAEVSPARIRGRLVTLNQFAIVISALVSSIVAWKLAETGNWRMMFGSMLIPIALMCTGLPFIPESPRWLMQKEEVDKARDILTKIDGPDHATREIQEIKLALQSDEKAGFVELFHELFRPSARMALLIALGLAAFQQLAGVSSLTYYTPTLFQKLGIMKESEAIKLSVFNCSWVFLCTVAAYWLVDRVGRRPLLLIGTLGMAFGQLLMGFVFKLNLSPKLALLCLFIANTAYITSLAPLAWLIMAEIFPQRLRALGMAIASIFLQCAAILVNQNFPAWLKAFKESSGSEAPMFWIFAFVCFAAFVFCLKLVPETKGRTLEEISNFWQRKKPMPSALDRVT